MRLNTRTTLLSISLILVPLFGWIFWYASTPETITDATEIYSEAGKGVAEDFRSLPALAFTEENDTYTVEDDTSEGISISFANEKENPTVEDQDNLTLTFPKDYSKPLQVKLGEEKTISITDVGGTGDYAVSTLQEELLERETILGSQNFFQRLLENSPFGQDEEKKTYLRYTSDDERKELLYAFQKSQASGEKKLKHWTIYKSGDGVEQEQYKFENAKISLNAEGEAEVYYFGAKQIEDEKIKAEVDPSLLERAQRTLEKEMGSDILNNQGAPDITIPKPFFLDKEGKKMEGEWKINDEGNILTISITTTPESYPLALDPTLSFTAPGQSNGGSVITSETGSTFLGDSVVVADLNSDGKTDLAVGAPGYSSNAGRIYIFHNDGSIATNSGGADVIITGVASSQFGIALAAGDFNSDGRTDVAAGAYNYSSSAGGTFIFYNDGSIPTTAATADITITGEASSSFGHDLISGDFDSDGRTDLAAGAYTYSSQTGRAYIFYNDGSIPTTAATADVTITGGATSNQFSLTLASGDFNSDSRVDLVVGAPNYSSATGRSYIFYNDGSIPTTAGTADVTITGGTSNNYFGNSFASGDFNSDGRIDLAVGAEGYSTDTGRAYIFYNDGSIPTTAGTADVTITGETTNNYFGSALVSGDFNSDGRTDLAATAAYYLSQTGRAYIFYNDGSIPTTAGTADVTITGDIVSGDFGTHLASGDLNADGKVDLVITARQSKRVYIFYSQNGVVNTNATITGEASSAFGWSAAAGDFNADGETDLAVGAREYTSYTGRVYIFYNDGSIPTTAATADVTITGETTSNNFGNSLTSGDFNFDGKIDLAVGANAYSTLTGRAYIFYNDGSIPTTAATADVTITGNASSFFGAALTSGDFNADSKTDLVVGADECSSITGCAYIFYNDGSIPTTAATADVTITGETTSNNFGNSLISGDFNSDGTTDLAVGAYAYSSATGRAYIFYNDGSIPTTAATADVTITGETTSNNFGNSLTSGDFNFDGKIDLAVGANGYSTNTGRAYIFHNDGSIPTTAATADVIITGEATSNYFGHALTAGDFNADGKSDLAITAEGYSGSAGRAYIFYNDGSIPTTAATADVTITGETTSNYFGHALTSGDFNADGKSDLVVGASGAGKSYVYEGQSNFAWKIQQLTDTSTGLRTDPDDKSGQEMKIIGRTSSSFGYATTSGDFNSDGRLDFAVGAYTYSSNTGSVYIFYNDGSLPISALNADVVIAGESTSDSFGVALTGGDLNGDGRTDLIVGATEYATSTGRVYIFHNDGSIPTTAAAADVIIDGESTSDAFGKGLVTGDFNADGKSDLAVGAYTYASTGRAYIFYSDGSIPTTAATADVTISSAGGSDAFGFSLISGDFNSDGTIDLAVGGPEVGSNAGSIYIFYNDGSIPTTAATADAIITCSDSGNFFSYSLVAGDFNSDGRTDIAAGGYGSFLASSGQAYIFYNDGSIPTTAATADVNIDSSTSTTAFGVSLGAGDFNADGRTDLAVGSVAYSTDTGRTHVFYNDGSIPTTPSTADIIITGESTSDYFGRSLLGGDFTGDGKGDLVVGASTYSSDEGRIYVYSFNDPIITGETGSVFGYALASGDFNNDGRTDLVVGAPSYSSNTGRAYIFYNDHSTPATADTADIIITGGATSDYFGRSLAVGDFNADGEIDLAISAYAYSTSTGRAYIFHNDGSIPTTAGTADVTITGEAGASQFGGALISGDFNADGETDLAVGATNYSSVAGRAYIFHNDGSIPTAAGSADVIIDGEASSGFGAAFASGDFNSDGKTDLAVSGTAYSTATGRTYIFHNDGSIPTTAGTADVTITGGATSDNFGTALAPGDFNADGRIDLVIGADGYSTNTGRAYVYYNDGSIPTTADTADVTITGQATSNYFGTSFAPGDFNADGKTDLIVGARGYSSGTGRVYTFYNDGSIPTTAATADATITEWTTSMNFGVALTAGDFNADGITDLSVGASGYSTSTGRTYIFISEAAVAATPPGVFNFKGTSSLKGSGQFK